MHFPGSEYQFFLANQRISTRERTVREHGLLRFAYFDDHPGGRGWEENLEYVQSEWSWLGIKWEVAVIHADRAEIYRPDRLPEIAGVWDFGDENRPPLSELTEKYQTVFIRPGYRSKLIRSQREAIRELITVQRKARFNCRIIIYGRYDDRYLYLLGADGGAVELFDVESRVVCYDPDTGKKLTRVNAKNLKNHPLTGLPDRGLLENSIAALLRIPVMMKEFYESLERIPVHGRWTPLMSIQHGIHKEKDFFAKPGEGRLRFGLVNEAEGDKILCDTCSLRFACRIYERGSVCALPDKETARMAEFFDTRNSSDVIDGISKILMIRAKRFDAALEREAAENEKRALNGEPAVIDPTIDALAGSLSKDAERYAKLIDPSLTRPQVAIQNNINNGPAEVESARVEQIEWTPRQISSASRALEASGIGRQNQTPEMITEYLNKENGIPEIIEGSIVNGMKLDF